MKNQSVLGPIEIEYPLGHKRRRQEGLPLLFEKFSNNLHTRFDAHSTAEIVALFTNPNQLMEMPIPFFLQHFSAT